MSAQSQTREQLEAQLAEIQAQIDAKNSEEKDNDLKTVKKLCRKHGFSSASIGSSLKDAALVANAKKLYKSQKK